MCTAQRKGLISLHLINYGSYGTVVFESPLYWNINGDSKLFKFSPRTNYTVVNNNPSSYYRCYDPNFSTKAILGCESCSEVTDITSISTVGGLEGSNYVAIGQMWTDFMCLE